MLTAVQPIPEAAKLHIRISDSDDESDGEQQAAKVVVLESGPLKPKESSDDLSQLARTARAAAEAVIRVTDGTGIPESMPPQGVPTQTVASCQEHQTGVGDNTQNPQSTQVYYIPQAYPSVAPSVYSVTTEQSCDQTSTVAASQGSFQNIQYQIPQAAGTQIQVPNIPPGAIIYQTAPPQSPMSTNQIIYQIPTTPQMNCETIMYHTPNVQCPQQQIENSSQTQIECDLIPQITPRGSRSRRKMTIGDFISSSSPEMVYPTVYVSPAGLLTVLLKHDVAVEMTLDKTIRVVNHKHKAAAACNSKGTSSCIYHSAAKVYQDTTTCEAEWFVPSRQLSIATDSLRFAQGLDKCYRMNNKTYEFTLAYPSFRDLSQDMSVSLLFSSSQYGPQLMEAYQEVANSARYRKHRSGATTVYINGMKIHQYEQGDVVVLSGQRYVRVSPTYGSMMVATHYVEILLENTHTLKVRRGDYRFKVTEDMMVMSDGYMECGMDNTFNVFCQLELLLVRTIIDNQQPCDVSRTGSREAYFHDQRRSRPLQMPADNHQPQLPFLPPTLAALREMYGHQRQPNLWWRKRGRSHYTIDLDKAIRMCEIERHAKDHKSITTQAAGDAGKVPKKDTEKTESKDPITLWSNMVISPEKTAKDESVSKGATVSNGQGGKCDRAKKSGNSEGSRKKQQRRGNDSNERRDLSETTRRQDKSREKSSNFGQDDRSESELKHEGKVGARQSQRVQNNGIDKANGRATKRISHSEDSSKQHEKGRNENSVDSKASKEKTDASRSGRKLYDGRRIAKEGESDKQKKTKKKKEKQATKEKTVFEKNDRNQARHIDTKTKRSPRKTSSKKLKSPRETEKNIEAQPLMDASEKEELKIKTDASDKKELKIKISPRDTVQKKKSPRDRQTPRGSKKRSPRESKRQSPRKPKERRNKKKGTTRRYTDTPEKLQAQVVVAKKSEVKQELKSSPPPEKKPDLTAEELVAFAANIVRNVVTEAVKIARATEQTEQRAKESEEEQLQQRASTILKHVFYIVSNKWKMYYSNTQNEQLKETQAKIQTNKCLTQIDENVGEEVTTQKTSDSDVEEKHNIQVDTTAAVNEIEDSQVAKTEEVVSREVEAKELLSKKLIETKLDKELSVRSSDSDTSDKVVLSSDDETLTEEVVYLMVNTTTSADNLDTMSCSKAPERRMSSSALNSRSSEPNLGLMEGKNLRCTKSEDMTSSTSGSVKISTGVETQNNSEGNITSSTANRLQATQKDLQEPKVDVQTIDIATNEQGSGESCEPAARKIEAETEAED